MFIGTSLRGPYTVTFSRPVFNVVVEGHGAYNCAGSLGSVVATTAAGSIVTTSFVNPFPADCGEDEISGTLMATVGGRAGIVGLSITAMSPASWQHVLFPTLTARSRAEYHVVFDRFPSCAPTGDPVLDQPAAQAVIDTLLALSNVTSSNLALRRERHALAWEDQLSGRIRFEISPREGNRCGADIHVPTDTPDEKVIGILHTHPHFRRENMSGCRAGARRYEPTTNGGGSAADWETARKSGVDVYAISPQVVHRLPWDTREEDRRRNKFRWRRTATKCLQKF